MDKNNKREMTFGVVFGIVVVIAAILEMVFNGISAADIFGAIKDIAGTLVVFVILFTYISEHKKVKGIRGSIESRMRKIEKKYNPLIREEITTETSSEAKKTKLEKVIRYEIAKDCDAIYGKQCKSYAPFFEISLHNPDKVEFYIRKKFFAEDDDTSFNANEIATNLQIYISKRYMKYKTEFIADKSGGKFSIYFNEVLADEAQLEELMSIINDMIFVYIVEKKA